MKEKNFRNQIYWLTFLLSMLVVWVHSYNAELFLGRTAEMEVIYRLEHIIGDRLGQMTVPGFFMISAYLFYRNFSWDKLWHKWRSRIRSILVPYIVWNTIYYLGYVIASRVPWLTDVVGKGVIALSLDAAADAILYYKYNYVFWYLYQLILLIILTPLLYLILQHAWIGAAFLVINYIGIWGMVTLPYLNPDALFYYSSAAYLALHLRKQVEQNWRLKRAAAGLICVACSALLFELAGRKALVGALVTSRFLAPVGIWLLMPVQYLPNVREFMTHNFFLYAVHFAIVRLINKAGAKLLPPLPWVPFVLYLLMPFLVVLISSLLALILRRYLPRLWYLLNGGR